VLSCCWRFFFVHPSVIIQAVVEELNSGLGSPSCLEAETANSKLEYCYPFLKNIVYRNSIDLVGACR
jgi:hypothetical protein